MSLLSSLHSGATGLQANSQDLSVVGDNIANANTIGFKRSRAAFEDALSHSLINGSGQVGMGTRLQAVQRILTQGSILNTGNATDLALSGDGYFVVHGQHDGRQGTYYTRAGQLTVDREGYLVTLDGLRLQGRPADATGVLSGASGDLQVGEASAPPLATENVSFRGNLQADAPLLAAAWDPTQPDSTSNFSSSVTIYDSLGTAHLVNVYYRRTGGGTWEWHALTDGGGLQGGTAGVPTEISTGTLTFDTNGALTGTTESSNFTPNGATSPQPLSFDFGTSTAAGGTGLDGFTQFASTSVTTQTGQDGSSAGSLAFVDVDPSGSLVGTFSNGVTRVLGRLDVATFSAPDQLRALGGNLFAQSQPSGEPSIGGAGEGGRGSIVSGALEQSNVDLAEEFVRMIEAQRGFQANSKTLSTADQLLAELISIKR